MVTANWTVRAICALLLCLGCVMQAVTADDATGEPAGLVCSLLFKLNSFKRYDRRTRTL
jgi:hypothetical protein